MQKILDFFQGKKTFVVAGLMVVYAVLAVHFNQMSATQAVEWVLAGLGFGTTRMAINDAVKKLS